MSPTQFGFLLDHSYAMQLLCIMGIIKNILDHGLPVNVDFIYLDLQKAFDSVPHNTLLHKVEKYGICGKFLNFFSI